MVALKAEADALRSKGKPLDTLFSKLAWLTFATSSGWLVLPTLSLELEWQAGIDYIWSQVSHADETKLYEERLKKIKEKRLRENLPAMQLQTIRELLSYISLSGLHTTLLRLSNLACVRERILTYLSTNGACVDQRFRPAACGVVCGISGFRIFGDRIEVDSGCGIAGDSIKVMLSDYLAPGHAHWAIGLLDQTFVSSKHYCLTILI